MMLLMPGFIAAFLVSLVVTGFLSRYRGRYSLLDKPNERSLHSKATPRAGGLAILVGIAAGVCCSWMEWWFPGVSSSLSSVPLLLDLIPAVAWVGAALLLVALISFTDDVRHQPALLRLSVHVVAASLLVFGGGYTVCALHLLPGWQLLAPLWVYLSFSILLTAWLINLYNFMDGMDGFAGGMAVIGFGTFALLGMLAHQPVFAAAALMVALAAAGFLVFNFPPASIFMGDVGSGSLGLLAAFFILWAEHFGIFPLWLAFMVFSPFLVDATWTVIRRAFQGKKPWQAHREHFYQRLVGLGWSHRRTTLWAYILMLKCSLFAVLAICFTATGIRGLLLGWLALTYVALIAYVNVIERKPVST